MFQTFMTRSVLRDPATDGNAGGGQGTGAAAPPNAGAPAFDPTAFKAELMGEFNRTLNGFAKTWKGDLQKMIPAQVAPVDPSNNGDHQPTHGDNKDPNFLLLKKELDTNRNAMKMMSEEIGSLKSMNLKTEQEKMDTQRDMTIAEALSGFALANETTAKDARKIFSGEIKWSTNFDKWVGPDDVTPADEYIKTQVKARQNWLATVETNPTGARPAGGVSGSKSWTLDDIDRMDTLTPADQDSLRTFIQQVHAQSRS